MSLAAASQLQALADKLAPVGMCCAALPISGQAPALLPDEAACVANAIPRRRHEFAVGRAAIRLALTRAGYDFPADQPIRVRADRRPDLPDDMRVSLSHSSTLCLAVATTDPRLCPGVDIERIDAVQPDDLGKTVSPWRAGSGQSAALLAFSAKEAMFKSQFSESGTMLDFSQAALLIRGDRLRLRFACGAFLSGRWGIRAGHILTLSWRQR